MTESTIVSANANHRTIIFRASFLGGLLRLLAVVGIPTYLYYAYYST